MFVGLVAFFVAYLSLYLRNFSVSLGKATLARQMHSGDATFGPATFWIGRSSEPSISGQGANPPYMLLSADGAPLILFSARMFEPATTDALFHQAIDRCQRAV